MLNKYDIIIIFMLCIPQSFDVPNGSGDFATYLANAAKMTVTNIETVAGEDDGSNGERINQSFQIQLSHQVPDRHKTVVILNSIYMYCFIRTH